MSDNTFEVKEKQNTLGGKSIPVYQYKNYSKKRELRKKVLDKFNGQFYRSIIQKDEKSKVNSLTRLQKREGESEIEYERRRANSFGKKSLSTLSIFPSVITMVYTNLLSNPGDKVYDPFMGHNSRAEDTLALGRKYSSRFYKKSNKPFSRGGL